MDPLDIRHAWLLWINRDLRVERRLRVSPRLTVAPFVDGYNMFNANPVQNVTASSGSAVLRPTNIVPPRIMRVGAKVTW
ncbi:MAG: hypothetical protein GEV06_26470 [Luteitalea sp.]|nr:hypothetical protein [Luteitalea sp.]